MKKLLISIVAISLLASCSTNKEETTSTEEVKIETAAVGGDFYCPMKCEGEKTIAEAGKCSVCTMDLVSSKETEETTTEEETHDHEHEHNHDEEGHQH